MQYYQVLISSETTAQGLRILDHLMAKQLVLGGPVFNGPREISVEFQGIAGAQGDAKRGSLYRRARLLLCYYLYQGRPQTAAHRSGRECIGGASVYDLVYPDGRQCSADQTPRRHVRRPRDWCSRAQARRRGGCPDVRAIGRDTVPNSKIIVTCGN